MCPDRGGRFKLLRRFNQAIDSHKEGSLCLFRPLGISIDPINIDLLQVKQCYNCFRDFTSGCPADI